MRQITAIIALLLLLSFSFALFTERITVQVLDQTGKPVEGAKVTANYQYRSKSPDSVSRVTDANGLANLTMNNMEYREDLTDYNYQLYARYGTDKNFQEASAKYVVGKHPNVITLTLQVYRVVVGVFDQNRRPLIALVKVGDYQKLTDSTGYAVFTIPEGNAQIEATYGSKTTSETVAINSEVARNFEIPLYPLKILVVNDNGDPLSGAAVSVAGRENTTGESGLVEFKNIEDSRVSYSVSYKGKRKSGETSLTLTPEYRVVFDTTAPLITSVNVTSVNGIGVVRLVASDSGKYPSGLGSGSKVYVKYSVDGGQTAQAVLYPSGRNIYRAEIPAQKAGSTVRYTIFVIDADGNEQSVSGRYEVVGHLKNDTGTNGGGDIVGGKGPFGIDWLWIIVGIVLLVVIAGAYFKFKEEQ